MRTVWAAVIMLATFACGAWGQEMPAESRVVSVGMFKNGLAVVKRAVTVPAEGTYRLADVPEPVHGTFWIESDASVETRVTSRDVEVPVRSEPGVNLQDDLAGKEVVIHFRDGTVPPVSGTVLKAAPATGADAWDRAYQRDRGYYWQRRQAPSGQGRFLILATAKGRTYVDASMIAFAQVENGGATVTRRRPVLLFTVGQVRNKPATIVVTYLTKGIAWAPSYRLDITDPKTLTIHQKAVIKNELEDIEQAELYLISGFPSVQFSHVTFPLALSTSWANFFQELGRRIRPGQDIALVSQQDVMMNVAAPAGGIDVSAVPTGEGPDVHYQPIGKRTLAEGDALALDVASAQAPYERIVEWLVPDTRHADGRYVRENERNENPEKYQDAAWDALRFKNPLPFPMTTGVAVTVANGRFQGQRMSYWANVGEQATVHITKALSIRTRSVEHEQEGTREIVWIGGDDYRKTAVKGQLSVSNHRNENVKLVIRRRFSGDLLEAEGEPRCELCEEGAWSVNKRNELTWTITLEPGQEQTLTYEYTVLVNT